ncbi:MAG: cupin domain-containing protein [Lentisphaerae bacterium]|nr:cupin domain-containing protein [Lentisphaerota bacterium]
MANTTRAAGAGLRLREQRRRLGLSLRACAVRAGVAPSFLSKIESGKAMPTIMTLQKIVEALESDLGAFFAGGGEAPDRLVFPRAGMKEVADADRLWRFAFPGRRDLKLALMYEEYKPRTRRIERERHPGDVYGIVMAGELTLALADGELRKARKGDAFVIPAGMEHMARNDGARTLVMVTAQIRA